METTRTRTRRPRSRPVPMEEGPGAGRLTSSAAGRAPGRLGADLAALGLVLTGVLLGLGVYRPGSAGVVGSFLAQFIRLWTGYAVHVAPILLLGTGFLL